MRLDSSVISLGPIFCRMNIAGISGCVSDAIVSVDMVIPLVKLVG